MFWLRKSIFRLYQTIRNTAKIQQKQLVFKNFPSNIQWISMNVKVINLLRLSDLIVSNPLKQGRQPFSLVAGQKQTRQSLTGRTELPPTIPFPSLFTTLLKLWNLNKINSWFSQKVHLCYSAASHKQFLISMQYKVLQGGKIHKISYQIS